MNVQNLAKFIIFLWLPLVHLELYNRHTSSYRLQHKNDSENSSAQVENEKRKPVEENPTKAGLDNLKLKKIVDGRASGNFHKKNSAKLNFIMFPYVKSEGRKSANKFAGSVKKDLSALNVNSKNRSAAIYKRYERYKRKRGRRKGFVNKIKKREAILDISREGSTSLEDYEEEEFEEGEEGNSTEMGTYLGAPCELTCSEKLINVFCDPKNRVCECEEKYPVPIGAGRGCEKPKQLGDQCFYAQTCSFFDPNAVCTQINHNAICQCKPGFHTVALRKGVKRMFCSEDVAVVSADLQTLLGVATGIAVLTGLICFVLRLFNGNRYPNTRHYANTNIAPPLLLSSDNQWINGVEMGVRGSTYSRSFQRSTMSLTHYPRSKGVAVPASRAGAARAAAILLIPCHLQASRHSGAANNSTNDDSEIQPNEIEHPSRLGSRRHSFSSVHSTTSSQRSMTYSARRFEQENQQREQRAAMKAAREEAARGGAPPTPSPMSTNDLITPSKNTEEDPLCSSTAESPAQSEPPALSISKGNIPMIPSKSIINTTLK